MFPYKSTICRYQFQPLSPTLSIAVHPSPSLLACWFSQPPNMRVWDTYVSVSSFSQCPVTSILVKIRRLYSLCLYNTPLYIYTLNFGVCLWGKVLLNNPLFSKCWNYRYVSPCPENAICIFSYFAADWDLSQLYILATVVWDFSGFLFVCFVLVFVLFCLISVATFNFTQSPQLFRLPRSSNISCILYLAREPHVCVVSAIRISPWHHGRDWLSLKTLEHIFEKPCFPLKSTDGWVRISGVCLRKDEDINVKA